MRGLVRSLARWPAYRWVCLFAVVYFAVALTGTWVNYVDLHISPAGTGGYDLSINEQALSSTIHSGRPFPFYEATNCGRDARCSLLLIHPVFIGYLVAVPYALGPSAFTLFAIQDAAIALAALPLFAIARNVTRSTRLALATAGVYLVWWPSFSGIFSFHWEAFIPLELFLIFWLWMSHRYWLAAPVVILSYLTLEIMPVLVFLVAAFFLLGWLRSALKYARLHVGYLVTRTDPTASAVLAVALGQMRRVLLSSRPARACLLLMLGSAVTYVLLHEFITSGGWILGLPPQPQAYLTPLSQPVHSATFTLGNLASDWQNKLTFWLVVLASLAMIPILAPRTLVLFAPWVAYTLLTTASYYQTGNQYSFIGAAVLFIGFAYGIAQLKTWVEGSGRNAPAASDSPKETTSDDGVWTGGPPTGLSKESAQGGYMGAESEATSSARAVTDPDVRASTMDEASHIRDSAHPDIPVPYPPGRPSKKDSDRHVWKRRTRTPRGYILIGFALAFIFAFNVGLNPLIPGTSTLRKDLGTPFLTQPAIALDDGFDPTAYNAIETMVGMIGSESYVAVAPAMFSFVANDPYAYAFYPTMNYSLLPFDAAELTHYVIIVGHPGTSYAGIVPVFLNKSLDDSSIFGVRAWIPTSYFGEIWLFQYEYTGATQVLGSSPFLYNVTYTPTNGLKPGGAGILIDNSSIGSAVNASNSSLRLTGQVFSTPSIALAEGTYQVALNVSAVPSARGEQVTPDEPVVSIDASGQSVGWYPPEHLMHWILPWSSFAGRGWFEETLTLTLATPCFHVVFSGSNLYDGVDFEVSSVSIAFESVA